MKKTTLVAIFGLGLVTLLTMSGFASAAGSDRLSGAIFTSLEDGSMVNANHYADKRDVYLNAGPGPNAPRTAAGLPDGNYYFQVTDPSGKTLLSTDPVLCREFRVEDGQIAEYLSMDRTYTVNKKSTLVPCYIEGWQHGKHDLGWSIDHDALVIQLMPYDDTPNRGGVYKVWATPTDKLQGNPANVDNPCGNGCFHGFLPAWSKTDNFKAEFRGKFEAPTITVRKFIDTNGNGVWDNGELEVGVDTWIDDGGWPVHVTDPNAIVTDGYTPYLYYAGMKGTHLVTEDVLSGWGQTAAFLDGSPVAVNPTVQVYIAYTSGEKHEVIFGNFKCFSVDGYKYDDLNGDGNLDLGETGIAGWTIELWRNGQPYATTKTDANGYYSFNVCIGGDFEVREVVPSGWTPTGPTSFTFTAASGESHTYDFFNFKWFKVCGYKYNDMNGNGAWDVGDVGIAGWKIELYRNGELYDTAYTDANGQYCFTVKQPGDYKIVEESRTGWVATYPLSGEYLFTAVSGQDLTYNFFNFKEGKICGHKWYDFDMDGVKDSGEQYIQGFKIQLYKDGSLYATAYTDANGYFCFEHLLYGTYTVKEVKPNNPASYQEWMQTYPGGAGTWVFEVTSGFEKTNADFGNVVVFTGGLTWGYWKTHTGYDSPPRDPAYDLLPTHPMDVDLPTADNDYRIDSDLEAKTMFDSTDPNCSGTPEVEKCRSLFRAQLLALHMNLLKFTDMGDMVYMYPGDSHSGQTVQQIYNDAIALLTDGQDHDFTSFQQTLDRINNNGEGTHVLVISTPPTPQY